MQRLIHFVLGIGLGMLIVFGSMSLAGYIFAWWLFRQAPWRDYYQPVLEARRRYGKQSQEYQHSLLTFREQLRAAAL